MDGFRHEHKYYIALEQALQISSRLNGIMKRDPHSDETGKYIISSVYFDNYENRALKASEFGVARRHKFRIRAYNGSDSYIKLEKKEKVRDLCKKTSVRINRQIYDDIMYGDGRLLLTLDHPVADEFYTALRSELYKPKTIVEYTRRVFVHPISDTRITIDTGIKGSTSGCDIFCDRCSLAYTVSPARAVLEVKYNDFLPEFIASVLPHFGATVQTSICKYVFGRTFK